MADPGFIRSRLLAQHGITAIFSDRRGGVSRPPFDSQNHGAALGDDKRHIEQNLQRLIRAAHLPGAPHQAKQWHGTALIRCQGAGRMHRQAADILTSDQPGTAVAVRTADCLPLLLADPVAGIVAAVHAGWRGTAANIAARAVEAMIAQGAEPQRLLAALGPCIGPCCFAIGDETATPLAAGAPDAERCISSTDDQRHADLAAINRLQLLQAGLTNTAIEIHRICTACDDERFFSYRRDGSQTGRQLAVVAIASTT